MPKQRVTCILSRPRLRALPSLPTAPAGSWSGTEAGNGDSLGAGSGAPDSEYGTPDNHERQAMLADSADCLVRYSSLCILHGMCTVNWLNGNVLPEESSAG